MPRPCTVCNHRVRDQIERALLKGEALTSIAERFGLPRTNLWRHKAHIRTDLAKMPEAAQMAHSGMLAAQLQALVDDAHELKRKAEQKRDYRTALVAVREITRLLEFSARLQGLDTKAQHNELHVHLEPEQALAIAQTYAARHSQSVTKTLMPEPDSVPQQQQLSGDLEAISAVSETEMNGCPLPVWRPSALPPR